jgi:hypothetical protein
VPECRAFELPQRTHHLPQLRAELTVAPGDVVGEVGETFDGCRVDRLVEQLVVAGLVLAERPQGANRRRECLVVRSEDPPPRAAVSAMSSSSTLPYFDRASRRERNLRKSRSRRRSSLSGKGSGLTGPSRAIASRIARMIARATHGQAVSRLSAPNTALMSFASVNGVPSPKFPPAYRRPTTGSVPLSWPAAWWRPTNAFPG